MAHHSKKQLRSGGKFHKAAGPSDDGRLPVDLKLPAGAPMRELGVGGSQLWGGYLIEHEKNPALAGTTKYATYSGFLANVNILAASVRMFLGMVAGAAWKCEPSDPEDPKSVEMCDEVEELLFDKIKTPWHRIVRRLAMYKFYGFSAMEWVAKKMDDGRMGYKDVQTRPQVTIERWFMDPHGEVLGIAQVDPQTGKEYAIPRSKLVYVVDDSIDDSPQGFGMFRHLAEACARLRRYLQLEGYGYEADMRGIPVGRAPLAELDSLVQSKKISKAKAQELLDGMADFLSSHIKNPALGLMIDSTPYRNTGEQRNVSNSPQWDMSLLDGGTYGHAHIHDAILRTQREMARVMGTEFMLLGENASGSRSLSNDKTSMFGLMVDDALSAIRDAVDDDLVEPLFELNGWDMELKPSLKTDTQVFRDPANLTAALRDLAQGGVQFDRQDESVQEILDLLGLSRFAPLEEIDTDLVISSGDAQQQAMDLMAAKPNPMDGDEEDSTPFGSSKKPAKDGSKKPAKDGSKNEAPDRDESKKSLDS